MMPPSFPFEDHQNAEPSRASLTISRPTSFRGLKYGAVFVPMDGWV